MRLLLLLAAVAAPLTSVAQLAPLDSAATRAALLAASQRFPKLGRVMRELQQHDPLLRQVLVVESAAPQATPAAAGPNGTVRLVRRFLEQAQPGFDDNRLVVVLYHEVGHLHYFAQVPPGQRSPEASELAAFAYSLEKTWQLAEAGDCEPLRTALYFMQRRSQSARLIDPHVRALQTLVRQPDFADYQHYVASHCPAGG